MKVNTYDMTFTPAMSDEVAGMTRRLAREEGEFYPVGSALIRDTSVGEARRKVYEMDAYMSTARLLFSFWELENNVNAWNSRQH